ncbi:aminotransferase class IV [Salinisphaera aquimarina]|uniref:Aminotransferase class IV n=1 Tax=Salinisphaera aquimarina TaxID=2094031 RepID=A0ABV7ESN9_9GAMM
MAIAYVNGDFLPLDEARISVLDRGFLFSDSVYEVIPVYAGHCFRLAEHLQRLDDSLAGLRISNPHALSAWTELVAALIDANDGGDLSVYIQVTRGAPPRRDHRLPSDVAPTVVAFCQSRGEPDAAVMRDGIGAITHVDTRWHYCSIKSTSLLANVMAADAARAEGATEALLVRDGAVLEGTSSNVFAVIDDRLITPALRETILPGITRAAVLEIATREGIGHQEIDTLTPAALAGASEIWITSSTREVFAVTRLDGKPVGAGRPGPLWTRMRSCLQAMAHE